VISERERCSRTADQQPQLQKPRRGINVGWRALFLFAGMIGVCRCMADALVLLLALAAAWADLAGARESVR
jgi:hypothetical protein